MKIQDLYTLYKQSYLVTTDTRNIKKDALFFALKGANFNGNKFAEEALKKGASYAIVDEEAYVTNSKIILVDDVLATLQNLASYHRKELAIPIIALTGSNGKTTTKELINAVLSKKYSTTATLGNLNNHIGVPLTLLSMTPATEIGIVEMGANHPKEIAFLANLATPDYGYITNFGKAHLEGFGSLEGVVKAKSELYDYLIKDNKTIFVNNTDAIQLEKTKNATRVLFDTAIKLQEVHPFVVVRDNEIIITTNLIGKYNYNNIVAAITIGQKFGVSKALWKEAIESYVPTNNRSQILEKGSNKIILDAYNANPTSMRAAIESFSETDVATKIVVLGDMFELGNTAMEEHQSLVDFITTLGFKEVLLVGENFEKVTATFPKFINFEALKEYLEIQKYSNTNFLIKGSRGMALERAVNFIG